ncbi:hypothetical protein DL98DRAFT_600965 [Cadophora sp. DSE1049]|nr:hypothetical protein DL98DRAFT_600965 [Cadophora sp. DSE1049]
MQAFSAVRNFLVAVEASQEYIRLGHLQKAQTALYKAKKTVDDDFDLQMLGTNIKYRNASELGERSKAESDNSIKPPMTSQDEEPTKRLDWTSQYRRKKENERWEEDWALSRDERKPDVSGVHRAVWGIPRRGFLPLEAGNIQSSEEKQIVSREWVDNAIDPITNLVFNSQDCRDGEDTRTKRTKETTMMTMMPTRTIFKIARKHTRSL